MGNSKTAICHLRRKKKSTISNLLLHLFSLTIPLREGYERHLCTAMEHAETSEKVEKTGKRLSKRFKMYFSSFNIWFEKSRHSSTQTKAEQTVQEGAMSLHKSPTCLSFLKTGRQKSLAIPVTVQINKASTIRHRTYCPTSHSPTSSASLSALFFCSHNSLRTEEGQGL